MLEEVVYDKEDEEIIDPYDSANDDHEEGRKLLRKNPISNRTYRIVYSIATLIIALFIWAVPRTKLHKDDIMRFEITAKLVIICSITMCSFFFVQGSNPGYVILEESKKSAGKDQEEGKSLMIEVETSDFNDYDSKNIGIEMKSPRKNVNENIDTVNSNNKNKLKKKERRANIYCKECGINRPVRTVHCRDCNKCVATFDHHCFFIGTCIGERNHCRFWWFLFCQFVELAMAINIVNTGYMSQRSAVDWVFINMVAFTVSALLWLLVIFVSILLCIHTWLALTNTTTIETVKGPGYIWYLKDTKECDLPFSRGCIENIKGFCCIRDGFWEFLGKDWKPKSWKLPRHVDVDRNSTNIFEHPWENKYYRCC